QAEDGIRDFHVTGVQTCALPICIEFWGDDVDRIAMLDPEDNTVFETLDEIKIYPANIFVTSPATINVALKEIQDDMTVQVESFKIGRASCRERVEVSVVRAWLRE